MAEQTEVAWGDTISLRYAIRLRDDTEIVSNLSEAEADTLTLGDGTLAQPLEQWLVGLRPLERHVFMLEPWQAFGSHNDELIQTLPRKGIPSNMDLAVDQLVEFTLPNGQTMAGHILEITADSVRVDFNHPLADCSIEFEVEVEAIVSSS